MAASRAPARFVRDKVSPSTPAPPVNPSAIRWLRTNLFSSWHSGLTTAALIALLIWIAPGVIRYFFVDAVWRAPNGDACRAPDVGACWAFVGAKIDYFRYGAYPLDQRWRADAVILFGAVLMARLLWRAPLRGRAAALFAIATPLLAAMVMPGPVALFERPWPDLLLLAGAIGFAATLLATRAGLGAISLLFFVVFPIAGIVLLRGFGLLGLRPVDASLWGGLLVTLIVSTVGIVASIPGGVLLALGRRSNMPAVRAVSALFIEIVRGVPLVTVLFMANTMLPLFVPLQYTPDRLARPLVGVAIFAAAYMAEVVRGGLQAMPKGQYEAARALGFGYWGTMRLVILPQALVLVIPGIVNSCIALFKDTTLVAAVGIYDFLNTVDTARIDPKWVGPSSATTGYVFAALVYWAFCFGMSRYSLAMERRLRRTETTRR